MGETNGVRFICAGLSWHQLSISLMAVNFPRRGDVWQSPSFKSFYLWSLKGSSGKVSSCISSHWCLQVKRILMPKWHIFGWHILLPYKWKESAFCEVGYDRWGPVVWKCYPRNKGDTKLLQLKKTKRSRRAQGFHCRKSRRH